MASRSRIYVYDSQPSFYFHLKIQIFTNFGFFLAICLSFLFKLFKIFFNGQVTNTWKSDTAPNTVFFVVFLMSAPIITTVREFMLPVIVILQTDLHD